MYTGGHTPQNEKGGVKRSSREPFSLVTSLPPPSFCHAVRLWLPMSARSPLAFPPALFQTCPILPRCLFTSCPSLPHSLTLGTLYCTVSRMAVFQGNRPYPESPVTKTPQPGPAHSDLCPSKFSADLSWGFASLTIWVGSTGFRDERNLIP